VQVPDCNKQFGDANVILILTLPKRAVSIILGCTLPKNPKKLLITKGTFNGLGVGGYIDGGTASAALTCPFCKTERLVKLAMIQLCHLKSDTYDSSIESLDLFVVHLFQ